MRLFWTIYVAALIVGLVALWPAPGDTGRACDFPAVVVPTAGKAVLYETWDHVPHEWGEGERVVIDWRGGGEARRAAARQPVRGFHARR